MASGLGSIHTLVAKNIKLLRQAYQIASKLAKDHILVVPAAEPVVKPAYARISKQFNHPAAWSRHAAHSRRWLSSRAGFTNPVRRLGSTVSDGSRSDPSNASSRISLSISRSSGRAPFASTLRPNLTGGALPRSAGGYGLGSGRVGGRRYFSHTPEAPAQVMTSVSQAMRAFMLNGGKIQYDGCDAQSGQKRFKTVSTLQNEARKIMQQLPRTAPGSFIDFNIKLNITAIASMATSGAGYISARNNIETLNSDGLLDMLSMNFSRALSELAFIMNDMRSLACLGDLPITHRANTLRVHFPGVDPDTVESLASEFNIRRGFVGQDPEFDESIGSGVALLFPFAPGQTRASAPMLHGQARRDAEAQRSDSFGSPSTLSNTDAIRGLTYNALYEYIPSFSQESPSTVSISALDSSSGHEYTCHGTPDVGGPQSARFDSNDDFDGIHRFIELCEASIRR